jgi:hypothetical protein
LGVKYKSCYFSNHAILLELSSRPFRKKFKFIGSDIGSDIRCLLEKSFKKKILGARVFVVYKGPVKI